MNLKLIEELIGRLKRGEAQDGLCAEGPSLCKEQYEIKTHKTGELMPWCHRDKTWCWIVNK